MTYRVNIIFVRHTVSELLPFFRSLLEHTDQRFRLVANGCTPAERAALSAEADHHGERVDYHEGSADDILTHGDMLERLLALETHDYFVFADSDVLATGPASFDGLLPDATEGARCSALPLWHRDSERVAPTGFRLLGGRFVEIEGSDIITGCSYAAGYHTDRLRTIARDRGIRLAHTRAAQLPADVRAELQRLGLDFDLYDTLKVANILLHQAGSPVAMVELDNIVHVGALSAPHDDPASGRSLRGVAKAVAGNLGPWRRIFSWRAEGLSWAEARSMCELAVRRKSAGDFVARLAKGDVQLETAPKWCRDPATFAALAALYRPDPTGQPAP